VYTDNYSDYHAAIEIKDEGYFILRNCTLIGFRYGLMLSYRKQTYGTIENCTIRDTETASIQTYWTYNYNFINNIFLNSTILLRSTDNINITDNIFRNAGIMFNLVNRFNVSNNIFTDGDIAINTGTETQNGYIVDNSFLNYESYGVRMNLYSHNVNIYYNNFTNNNIDGVSQACDDGANNTWYNDETKKGNFWSDYSGEGNYTIDGSAKAFDPYPIIIESEEDNNTNNTSNNNTDNNIDTNLTSFNFYITLLFVFVVGIYTVSNKKKT